MNNISLMISIFAILALTKFPDGQKKPFSGTKKW